MKLKLLLFSTVACFACTTTLAQTSYGNLNQGNAGNGGGSTNSYFGYQAAINNTGFFNTFIGYQSGYTNTTGGFNTANGAWTLYSNSTGQYNTANGYGALYDNTVGDHNTANGYLALSNNTNGDANTATGYHALSNNITGDQNTANGYQALYANTASFNTANGYQALYTNTTGSGNIANGHSALYSNESGDYNVANGGFALFENVSGEYNTANGHEALLSNKGNNNTGNGARALFTNDTGHDNTASGYEALYNNDTGYRNTASGVQALYGNGAGYRNTATGYRALYSNTSGDYNTAIGYSSGPNTGTFNNTTALGYDATPTASNQVRIGNAFVTSIGGYEPWTNLSDARFKKEIKEDIPGLEFITKLRPVSYTLDRPGLRIFLGKETTEGENTAPETYRRSIGFVAQEVERLLTENGYTPIGIESPQNEQDHYSIRYSEFVVPLTKAVQELNALVEAQQQEIANLKSLIYDTKASATESKITGPGRETAPEGFALHQNVPNPFNRTTVITTVIPETVQQAKIVVYNLQGLELEHYGISGRGNTTVEISAGRFPSGMYIYALIADHKVIDTKKMILTK